MVDQVTAGWSINDLKSRQNGSDRYFHSFRSTQDWRLHVTMFYLTQAMDNHLGPLLLTWFNFNTNMDK